MFITEHWELMPDQRSPATTNTQLPPEHPNTGNRRSHHTGCRPLLPKAFLKSHQKRIEHTLHFASSFLIPLFARQPLLIPVDDSQKLFVKFIKALKGRDRLFRPSGLFMDDDSLPVAMRRAIESRPFGASQTASQESLLVTESLNRAAAASY
jgi:hypothetical protein